MTSQQRRLRYLAVLEKLRRIHLAIRETFVDNVPPEVEREMEGLAMEIQILVGYEDGGSSC